jgi:hypothetical protein
MFGMMVSFFFLTQFFQIVQGRSAFQAGLLIIPTAVTMMIAAPVSGVLVKRVGPRWLVLASAVAMTTGLLLLTQASVGSSTFSIVGPLMLFGLGGGLGLAPLTDTVMAAVPVADAGIGSAVNDVSRELGAALGIATVGSFVNAMYRSNFAEAAEGVFPPEAAEAAGEGIGVAHVVAERLGDTGPVLVDTANVAFLDAMTFGFGIGAAFVAIAGVIAVTLIPTKMREVQLEADDIVDDRAAGSAEPGFGPEPVPAPA